MDRLQFIIGIIFFIGSIFLIVSNYDNLQVQNNGRIIKMRIEKLPSSCIGAKIRYFIILSDNGKLYEKATRGNFCEMHHVGEFIEMKKLEGSETILFPKESVSLNLISFAIVAVFGLILAIVQANKYGNCNNK